MTQVLTSPYVKRPLKSQFADLASPGYCPRAPERCRAAIVGEFKNGKSSFAMSCPTGIVLDFDGGANAVMRQRATRINLSGNPTTPPGSPEHIKELDLLKLSVIDRYEKIKAALLADALTREPQFTTVFYDTADAAIEQFSLLFCQENKIESLSDFRDGRMGWYLVRQRFMRDLQELENAGYGVYPVFHLDKRIINQGETSKVIIEFAVSDSYKRAILKWVDQVLHVSSESLVVYPEVVTMVQGREVRRQDKENPQTVTQVVLRSKTVPGDSAGGCRVAIPDKLVLPPGEGWGVYEKAYWAEVARVKGLQAA